MFDDVSQDGVDLTFLGAKHEQRGNFNKLYNASGSPRITIQNGRHPSKVILSAEEPLCECPSLEAKAKPIKKSKRRKVP